MLRLLKVPRSRKPGRPATKADRDDVVQSNAASPVWKRRVLAELDARKARGERPANISQLAQAIGETRNTVWKFLKDNKPGNSRIVPKINLELGWRQPTARELELAYRLSSRTDEERELIDEIVDKSRGHKADVLRAMLVLASQLGRPDTD